LYVKQKNSASFAAIGFGLAKKISIIENQKNFDAVYSIDENEWNGNVSLQLKLRDIRN
jgi:single-stranded-DNA-specific exonuclease